MPKSRAPKVGIRPRFWRWVGVAGCSVSLVTSCEQRKAPVLPLLGRGVEAALLSRADTLSLRGVRNGDWLLRSNELAVAVAGARGAGDRSARVGDLVSLELRNLAPDASFELRTLLRDPKRRSLALGAAVVRAELRDGRPELVISRRAAELELETRLVLLPGTRFVRLETRLTNTSASHAARLQIGDRVLWSGRAAFVPGFGDASRPGQPRAAWIARQSGRTTYALAFPSGAAQLELAFDHVGPSGVTAWSDQLVIQPRGHWDHARLLVRSEGGVAEAAGLLWSLTGVGHGTLEGRLAPPPSWARVEAHDASGGLVLRAEARASGEWTLPLPPGKYQLSLHSPGGSDQRSVELAEAGSRLRVDLIAPEPGRLHFLTISESGEPIAARWMIHGTGNTPDPKLDAVPFAEGNTVFSVSGSGSVELPDGSYRVRASHGPEYSLHEQPIVVAAGRGATARARLERVVDADGWLACELHLHASPSFDSEVALDERVASLLTEGIGFAAATDHDTVTDYTAAFASLKSQAAFASVPGVEITTRSWGHFNAFPYHSPQAPAHTDLTPARIFENVRADAAEALIQVNHPRLWEIGYFRLGELDASTGVATREGFSFAFDTLEVFNGFDLGEPGRVDSNLQEWFQLLNLGHRPTAVGNSDSHRLTKQWAGYPRTYVRAATPDPKLVVSALKRGQAVVTNGPLLGLRVNGAGLGELATAVNQAATLDITVSAPSWMSVSQLQLVVNGQVREELRLEPKTELKTPLRWTKSLTVALDHDAWVLLLARGREPLEPLLPGAGALPLAFTNPVYVDGDGDGAFTPPARSHGESR